MLVGRTPRGQKRMASEIQKRSTRQLTAIYEALRGAPSHPSADEIFLRARQMLPRISLGTVYRNLQRLIDEGKLRVVLSGGRSARYDPVAAEHDHFICRQCGQIFDVSLENDRQVNVTSLIEQGFTVEAHSLSIHGFCRECAQKHEGRSRAKGNTEGRRERQSQGRGVGQPRERRKA